mmetsp:Transcript_24423/g.66729  ORF Transcript_24423/g.66729 Transcript_24423/m.66729 type:complete len:215 (+) Transcript_24423:210-854(+)|eukprot:CAMPEP_0202384324 /NCGR_PEP_ID=MMETSP1127-20130417/54669_1 /ASSEMBLY_ACC=CAM_ASM_000462 /TAXON_ID=3047 /ORGANISM="Dunaliella tertiolecta, Strain CCMP1320" /LENGTH=214 /DNA_ID=CAMNT_0048984113 /DNA_START=215 /DNA_END=859 /DNA_ORIENTATION=+
MVPVLRQDQLGEEGVMLAWFLTQHIQQVAQTAPLTGACRGELVGPEWHIALRILTDVSNHSARQQLHHDCCPAVHQAPAPRVLVQAVAQVLVVSQDSAWVKLDGEDITTRLLGAKPGHGDKGGLDRVAINPFIDLEAEAFHRLAFEPPSASGWQCLLQPIHEVLFGGSALGEPPPAHAPSLKGSYGGSRACTSQCIAAHNDSNGHSALMESMGS